MNDLLWTYIYHFLDTEIRAAHQTPGPRPGRPVRIMRTLHIDKIRSFQGCLGQVHT